MCLDGCSLFDCCLLVFKIGRPDRHEVLKWTLSLNSNHLYSKTLHRYMICFCRKTAVRRDCKILSEALKAEIYVVPAGKLCHLASVYHETGPRGNHSWRVHLSMTFRTGRQKTTTICTMMMGTLHRRTWFPSFAWDLHWGHIHWVGLRMLCLFMLSIVLIPSRKKQHWVIHIPTFFPA